jgi:hypothetical protein
MPGPAWRLAGTRLGNLISRKTAGATIKANSADIKETCVCLLVGWVLAARVP